jgi:hypothetical protein
MFVYIELFLNCQFFTPYEETGIRIVPSACQSALLDATYTISPSV